MPLPPMTVNCTEGRHDVCRCELPGQDTRWAHLIVGFNEATETFYPLGFCACWCHDVRGAG